MAFAIEVTHPRQLASRVRVLLRRFYHRCRLSCTPPHPALFYTLCTIDGRAEIGFTSNFSPQDQVQLRPRKCEYAYNRFAFSGLATTYCCCCVFGGFATTYCFRSKTRVKFVFIASILFYDSGESSVYCTHSSGRDRRFAGTYDIALSPYSQWLPPRNMLA